MDGATNECWRSKTTDAELDERADPPVDAQALDTMNAEVTAAILAAEEADHKAAAAWRRVIDAETALAKALPPGSPEHGIAVQGVKTATDRLLLLSSRELLRSTLGPLT